MCERIPSGCLNCDFWDYGDRQDYCAFAIWGCRSAVGTGLEDGRFVCCWMVQELGGGARTGAGPGSVCQEGGRVVRGDGLGAEGDEVGVVGGRGGCRRVWRRRGSAGRGLRYYRPVWRGVGGCGGQGRRGRRGRRRRRCGGRRKRRWGGGVLSGKVESRRRRPAARGSRQGWGMRMLARARAGRISDGREAGIRMGGLGRGGRSSSSRNCFSLGDWEAADGGDGNGGQGAGEVAAVEDGAAGAVGGRSRRGQFWLFRQLHKCGGLTATLQ